MTKPVLLKPFPPASTPATAAAGVKKNLFGEGAATSTPNEIITKARSRLITRYQYPPPRVLEQDESFATAINSSAVRPEVLESANTTVNNAAFEEEMNKCGDNTNYYLSGDSPEKIHDRRQDVNGFYDGHNAQLQTVPNAEDQVDAFETALEEDFNQNPVECNDNTNYYTTPDGIVEQQQQQDAWGHNMDDDQNQQELVDQPNEQEVDNWGQNDEPNMQLQDNVQQQECTDNAWAGNSAEVDIEQEQQEVDDWGQNDASKEDEADAQEQNQEKGEEEGINWGMDGNISLSESSDMDESQPTPVTHHNPRFEVR